MSNALHDSKTANRGKKNYDRLKDLTSRRLQELAEARAYDGLPESTEEQLLDELGNLIVLDGLAKDNAAEAAQVAEQAERDKE